MRLFSRTLQGIVGNKLVFISSRLNSAVREFYSAVFAHNFCEVFVCTGHKEGANTGQMAKVQLAGCDLNVSRVCIGCWQFNDGQMDGSKTWNGQSYELSKSIVDKALEMGVNFFDTAEVSQF